MCKTVKSLTCCYFFIYILSPCADNNINVQCNIAHFEEVETSDHILHLSDKNIALQKKHFKMKICLNLIF